MNIKMISVTLQITVFISGNAFCEDLPTLVKAEVKKIQKATDNGDATVELEIIHVYSGDPKIKGTTFQDYYNEIGFSRFAAVLPFKIGEIGLWSLKEHKNIYYPAPDRKMPFQIRCRRIDNTRYEHIELLANAIEKYAKTEKNVQINKLSEMITDRTPEIAMWAVGTLGGSKEITAKFLMHRYCDKKYLELPLAAQIVFDEIQSKKKMHEWTENKTRLELLSTWVSEKADDFHASLILARIDKAYQNVEISKHTAFDLARTAAENNNWTLKNRQDAIKRIGLIARRSVDDEPAYTWLFEQVKNNKELEVRKASANVISTFISMRQGRVKDLQAFVSQESNKEITKALQAAIDKYNKREKK